MDLFEYQARDVFEKHGVPVLPGIVATTPGEARAAYESLGAAVAVVKAQVKIGEARQGGARHFEGRQGGAKRGKAGRGVAG